MTTTVIQASQGSATFSDLNVVVNLTVANTISGDTVEIINSDTSAVLGSATQSGTTTAWRAAILLPTGTTVINVSARTKRGTGYSTHAAPAFTITYQAP